MDSYITLETPLVLYKLAVVLCTITHLLLLVSWLVMLLAMIHLTRSRVGLMGMFFAVGFFSSIW